MNNPSNHKKELICADLAEVMNRHGLDSNTNTPDYILADYLFGCLAAFSCSTKCRDIWFGGTDRQEQKETLRGELGNGGPEGD